MEPERSLLHSQQPATCPYLEPDQSIPCPTPHPITWRSILMSVPLLCRTKVSVRVRGTGLCFVTKPVFAVRSWQHHAQTPSCRTTPCRLSATAYSIYSQLPSISEAVSPSATWERAMPWWQGPTYHGYNTTYAFEKFLVGRIFNDNVKMILLLTECHRK